MRLNLLARQHGELVTGRKRTVPTFGEAVETVIAVHAAGWKDGGRSEKLWRSSLRDYAMPKLGGRPVNRINRADVMAVLLPIWNEKRVTARRVRQRISAVNAVGGGAGLPRGQPGREAIGAALPKNGVRPQHLAAVPYAEVAGALEQVRGSGAYRATVLAFEFLVLTAYRSGEVRGALWEGDGPCGTGVAHSARADEDEPGAPGSAVPGGAGGAAGGAGARGRLAGGVPFGAGRPALRGGDLEAGPGTGDRGDAARVPFELPGPGGGVLGRAPPGV